MPRLSIAAVLMISAVLAQEPDAATKLVATHQAWTKASTKGASLTIREASRSGQEVTLRVYAKGLPKNGVFSLMSWPLVEPEPTEIAAKVTIGADGVAMTGGKPVDVTVTPLPGEPARLGLVSSDRMTMAFASMTPNPLKAEDRGCSIQATLLSSGAEVLLIEGSGFPANADFTKSSNSEGERQSGSGKAGADGKFSYAVLPYKEGLAKGTAKIQVKGPQCSPSLDVQWGRRFRTRN